MNKKEIEKLKRDYSTMEKFWSNTAKENFDLRNKIAELENRHQSDCITINQLHTALDVMTEKYQRLREIHGL